MLADSNLVKRIVLNLPDFIANESKYLFSEITAKISFIKVRDPIPKWLKIILLPFPAGINVTKFFHSSLFPRVGFHNSSIFQFLSSVGFSPLVTCNAIKFAACSCITSSSGLCFSCWNDGDIQFRLEWVHGLENPRGRHQQPHRTSYPASGDYQHGISSSFG